MSDTYRRLSDLRLVDLALHLEETLEAYEEFLRNDIVEVPVRAKLSVLFTGGPFHERLRAAQAALHQLVQSDESPRDSPSILQTLLDCERIARDFYLRQLDRLSDPTLVELFRGMAAEEEGHLRAVEGAIQLNQQLALERRALAAADEG